MDALSDPIDLFVHLSAMVISFLTRARNSERYAAGMPRTNTGNFPQTLVSLTRQFLRVPPGCNTCKKREKC